MTYRAATRRWVAALLISNALVVGSAAAQTVTDLGTLGGGFSSAAAISADGTVVVGQSSLMVGGSHAFRYDSVNGMQDLGSLGGSIQSFFDSSYSTAVSANGNVVVGGSSVPGNPMFPDTHAFRYESSTGMIDLGTLGGSFSVATGVSADGTIVVGHSWLVSTAPPMGPPDMPPMPMIPVIHAFRSTTAGMQDLGTLGGTYSSATAITADGGIIFGISSTASGTARPFRWTLAGGMEELDVAVEPFYIAAASADGSVLAGSGAVDVVRYDSANGLQHLGAFGGTTASGNAINAVGTVIVGAAQNMGMVDTPFGPMPSFISAPFLWTSANGMQDLNTLSGSPNVQLWGANGISGDGNRIVGNARFGESFGDHAYLLDLSASSGPASAPLPAVGGGLISFLALGFAALVARMKRAWNASTALTPAIAARASTSH